MSRKSRVVGIFLAAVILVGTISGLAFAQSGTQAVPGENYYQSFVAKLATNLGLEQNVVKAALDTTKQQMLDEAVQQGSLTQEQADQMAKRMQDGRGLLGFRGAKNHDDSKGFTRDLDSMATVLGMTSDELKAEMQSGKKMQQLVEEHGMTMDQFNEKMLEVKKEALAKAVADGKLTQEQADQMLSRTQDGKGWAGFGGDKNRDGIKGFARNLDSTATVLGMTADNLKSEMQSGKKMQQIVEEHGMTMDQFSEKMLEVKKDALAKAVADGKLTQDQADKMLQRMDQNHTAPNSDLNQ